MLMGVVCEWTADREIQFTCCYGTFEDGFKGDPEEERHSPSVTRHNFHAKYFPVSVEDVKMMEMLTYTTNAT